MLKILASLLILISAGLFLLALAIYIIYMGMGKKVTEELKVLNSSSLPVIKKFKVNNPYQGPGKYYKAQLHTHTVKSDGKISPSELVQQYKEAGYSFLAITDHDQITEYHELDDEGFITIPGEEMTHPRPFWPLGNHLLRLFVKETTSRRRALQERINKTIENQGILVINHPSTISGLGTQRWRPSLLSSLDNLFFIEIVNHYSEEEKNMQYWHGLLKRSGPENPIWGMAGDDAHRFEEIDQDWIMARVEKISVDSLYQALKKGSFYATQGPLMEFNVDDHTIQVTTEKEREILYIDADHNIRKKLWGENGQYNVKGDEGFIRIEVKDKETGKKAWSQPFWLIKL